MLHVNRTQKLPSGQESSCACSLLMLKINFTIKASRKHQKQLNMFKIHSLSKLKEFISIFNDQDDD